MTLNLKKIQNEIGFSRYCPQPAEISVQTFEELGS